MRDVYAILKYHRVEYGYHNRIINYYLKQTLYKCYGFFENVFYLEI